MVKSKGKKKKTGSQLKRQWFSRNLRSAIVLILGAILLALVFNPSMFTGGDNAQYITLAKSILKGQYHNLAFIGAPLEIEIPPGYPTMIAPLVALSSTSYIPTKLLSFALMLVGILLTLFLFDKYKIPKVGGMLVALALLSNPAFNEFSHWTLTEAPYFAISILGVYLFDKHYNSEKLINFILASAVVTLSIYIRPVSIPLIFGAFIFLMVRKLYKKAGIFILTGVVVYGPWFLRNILVREGGEESFYLINFFGSNTGGDTESPALFAKVFTNLGKYLFRELPILFTSMMDKSNILTMIIGIAAAVLIVGGIVVLFSKKKSFLPYYAVLYCAMLMVYNPRFATFRYIMPLIPIFLIAIWETLNIKKPINIAKFGSIVFVSTSGVMLFVAILSFIPIAKMNLIILKQYSVGNKYAGLPSLAWVQFIESCKWIKSNTPEDANLISRKPRISYILSDRPGKVYKFTQNSSAIMAEIDSVGADYVIVDRISGTTQAYLIPTIQAYPGRFSVVYKTTEPVTYVFKVIPLNQHPPQNVEHPNNER